LDDRFVSKDGESVLVLLALPERTAEWPSSVVGRLYRRAEVAVEFKAGQVMTTGQGLKFFAKNFAWLAGRGGLPGTPPRASADGEGVELDTTEGSTLRISLADGAMQVLRERASAVAAAPPSEAAAAGVPQCEMYQWNDRQDGMQFADSLDAVPEKYRRSVRCVDAEISTVDGPSVAELRPSRSSSTRSTTVEPVVVRTPAVQRSPTPSKTSVRKPVLGVDYHGTFGAVEECNGIPTADDRSMCKTVKKGTKFILGP
jgi:hypothetical protein